MRAPKASLARDTVKPFHHPHEALRRPPAGAGTAVTASLRAREHRADARRITDRPGAAKSGRTGRDRVGKRSGPGLPKPRSGEATRGPRLTPAAAPRSPPENPLENRLRIQVFHRIHRDAVLADLEVQ